MLYMGASLLAASAAGLLSIVTVIFVIEVIAALIVRPRSLGFDFTSRRPAAAVVVPAHNEGRGLIPTLCDIQKQLESTDRLIVVADNCTDETAIIAAEAGAEVFTRNDQSKIGKGYALDWAIQELKLNPPDVVVFVDADCRLAKDTIDRLVRACMETLRPTQALNLMTAPTNSEKVAEFAWRVKNWVRPLGLLALGFPCQLMGTGMAFPWKVIRSADLASGAIVEDLKLGLDMALVRCAARFCPSARVSSIFPSSADAGTTQRQRWEKGHIGAIMSFAPKMMFQAVARRNLDLLVLTLDLIVPPLSLLGLLLISSFVIAAVVAVLGGSSLALFLSLANAVGFGFAIFLCWMKFGRDILSAQVLSAMVQYVFSKLPLYNRIFTGKTTAKWVRTDRDARPPPSRDFNKD